MNWKRLDYKDRQRDGLWHQCYDSYGSAGQIVVNPGKFARFVMNWENDPRNAKVHRKYRPSAVWLAYQRHLRFIGRRYNERDRYEDHMWMIGAITTINMRRVLRGDIPIDEEFEFGW